MAPDVEVDLTGDTRLVEDLGLDSLRLMELVLTLQLEFGLEPVPEAELVAISTIADLTELVTRKAAS